MYPLKYQNKNLKIINLQLLRYFFFFLKKSYLFTFSKKILKAFNTTCYSQYELLNNRKFVGDDETTKFVELTSVFLEATWNMNPTSNFSLPSIIFSTPPNSSNICLVKFHLIYLFVCSSKFHLLNSFFLKK